MEHDEIAFVGAGRYWLTDGHDSVDLGVCATADEVRAALEQARDNGCNTDDGWRIEREPMPAPAHKLAVGDRVVSVCGYRRGQAGTVVDLLAMQRGPGYGVRFDALTVADLAEHEVKACSFAAAVAARRERQARLGSRKEARKEALNELAESVSVR